MVDDTVTALRESDEVDTIIEGNRVTEMGMMFEDRFGLTCSAINIKRDNSNIKNVVVIAIGKEAYIHITNDEYNENT